MITYLHPCVFSRNTSIYTTKPIFLTGQIERYSYYSPTPYACVTIVIFVPIVMYRSCVLTRGIVRFVGSTVTAELTTNNNEMPIVTPHIHPVSSQSKSVSLFFSRQRCADSCDAAPLEFSPFLPTRPYTPLGIIFNCGSQTRYFINCFACTQTRTGNRLKKTIVFVFMRSRTSPFVVPR